MRKVTDVSEQENFRLKDGICRVDFIEPEPIGTIILVPFVITGYSQDCDGSALAEIAAVDRCGETTGWTEHNISPDSRLVVSKEELAELFKSELQNKYETH